ncbi:MAG: quinone-dependent dihydroorotate dehydrogenase [Pseudomonadota bacterium]
MAWYHPLLFALDAETAHRLTVRALALAPPFGRPVADPRLAVTVAGLSFPNPVGLAAGVDKDAVAIAGWFGLGFGSVEVGTLTPLPQPGNPKPRLFRLRDDRAVINRMGFNNGGLDTALQRIVENPCVPAKAGTQPGPPPSRGYIVGVNVGANKDTDDRITDYRRGVARASSVASYITINISSPNTPGLRDLQHGAALTDLLAACRAAAGATPLFLKVAPDLDASQIDELAKAALDHRLDALIVSNTTVSRPALRSRYAAETGGLSGAPLAALARRRLADFRTATGGALPLISVGGIDSAAEAYARIRAGAALVQLYTALVYEGPGLARRIATGLSKLLERDGFASVADAVGVAP